jgi:hypothetical protein
MNKGKTCVKGTRQEKRKDPSPNKRQHSKTAKCTMWSSKRRN